MIGGVYAVKTKSRILMIISSYLLLDMLSTLLIWIGALGRGRPPCGDMSIVDVPHMFKE